MKKTTQPGFALYGLILALALSFPMYSEQKLPEASVQEIIAAPTADIENEQGALIEQEEQEEQAEKIAGKIATKKKRREMVSIDYDDKPIVDIINLIAAKKGYNLILPAGKDALTSKVTFRIKTPMSVDDAWDFLYTILDVDGYSIVPKGSMYMIVKNNTLNNKPTIVKETLPFYIGDPDTIPDSDERIRFLYYLSNLRVSEDQSKSTIEGSVLKQVLSPMSDYQVDTKTNSILVTDKATNVKSAILILAALDQPTFREKLEILPLRYVDATTLATFINNEILKPVTDDLRRYQMRFKKASDTSLFQAVRVVADPRTNVLVLLGREQAVNYLKDLIQKTLDIPQESGQSILHVYALQYLNATTFAVTLDNIVKTVKAGGAVQSKEGTITATGTEKMFEGVIIKADIPDKLQATSGGVSGSGDQITVTSGQTTYYGGNKLIIAAKNDDWQVLKVLIEELDKPQRQVILEVLIADLTINEQRALGSLTRNPLALPLPGGVNVQSAQLGPVVVAPDPVTPASSIAVDLLPDDSIVPGPAITPAGASLISISDQATGKVWNIGQLMSLFSHKKILAHPHVVTLNNQQAVVKIGDTRYVQDTGESTVAAQVIKRIELKALLTVAITPRVSSADIVTLNISIGSQDFRSDTDNTIIKRTVNTSAIVRNTEILVLGGLSRIDEHNDLRGTPLLSTIPLFKWLTSYRSGDTAKTSLTIFITPTIIEPRVRDSINEYTNDYLTITENLTKEGQLFGEVRDPVTHLFFNFQDKSDDIVETYMAREAVPFTERKVVEKTLPNRLSKAKSAPTKSHAHKQDKKVVAQRADKKPRAILNISGDMTFKQLLENEENPLL